MNNPRAIVAVILAIAVALVMSGLSDTIRQMLGLQRMVDGQEEIDALNNLMFTALGILGGYIAGKDTE